MASNSLRHNADDHLVGGDDGSRDQELLIGLIATRLAFLRLAEEAGVKVNHLQDNRHREIFEWAQHCSYSGDDMDSALNLFDEDEINREIERTVDLVKEVENKERLIQSLARKIALAFKPPTVYENVDNSQISRPAKTSGRELSESVPRTISERAARAVKPPSPSDRHVRLYHRDIDTPAFQSLDCYARSLLIELTREYDGRNNGQIILSIKTAMRRLGVGSPHTAVRAFRQLEDRGWIVAVSRGAFSGGARNPTKWELTTWPLAAHGHAKLLFRRWTPR